MEPHPERPSPAANAPRIGVLSGNWARDIGNAFVQLGAAHVLRKAIPESSVVLIAGASRDGRGRRGDAIDAAAHLDLDAVVVTGDGFRADTMKATAATVRAQHRKGAEIIVLSAGMPGPDQVATENARAFLTECPPRVLVSRDAETLSALGDLAAHAYDGIDAAAFVSEVYAPAADDLGATIVLNFDRIPEPKLAPTGKFGIGPRTGWFEFEGTEWSVRQPALLTRLSRNRRVSPLAESILDRRRPSPGEIAGMTVVRTAHRSSPRFATTRRGRYTSDIPYPYLNLYANAKLTLSDRAEACVAALAYGNHAMLFGAEDCPGRLRRLGAEPITGEPCRVDPEWLREQKAAMIGWLARTLAAARPGTVTRGEHPA